MKRRFIKFALVALVASAIPVQAFGYDYMYSKSKNYATDNNGNALNGWHNFTTDPNRWNRKFEQGFDVDANVENTDLPFFSDWVYFENGKFKTGWFKSDDGNWYYLNEYNGSIVRDNFRDGYYLSPDGVWTDNIPEDSNARWCIPKVQATMDNVKRLEATGYWSRGYATTKTGEKVSQAIRDCRASLGFTKSVESCDLAGYPLSVPCNICGDEVEAEMYLIQDGVWENRKFIKVSPEKFVELFNSGKLLYFRREVGVNGGASGDSAPEGIKTSIPYVTDASLLE